MSMNKFQEMFQLDVSEHIDKRSQSGTELSYLSWAWAWAKVNEVDSEASYSIKMFTDENNVQKPYLHDPVLGYMVMTSVTMFGKTKEMWLPVMNSDNKAMLDHPWEWVGKYKSKKVETATMFDINKTLMRCLVKNIAMFGLGLKLYAGEDLPSTVEETKIETEISAEDKQTLLVCKTEDELAKASRKLLNKLGASYTQAIVSVYEDCKRNLEKANANLHISAENA